MKAVQWMPVVKPRSQSLPVKIFLPARVLARGKRKLSVLIRLKKFSPFAITHRGSVISTTAPESLFPRHTRWRNVFKGRDRSSSETCQPGNFAFLTSRKLFREERSLMSLWRVHFPLTGNQPFPLWYRFSFFQPLRESIRDVVIAPLS